ncbi:MAG: hypothetical protein IJ229_02265 [Clostridia bacterium]|nr:hypothetical protein [Clostridia bacterium]MBR1684027.1 hypothetical protein [Clostridia bacterium]
MPRFTANTRWYGWNAPKEILKKTGWQMLLLLLLSTVLSLAGGMIPTGVTRHNWVSFAATAALVALAAEIIGVVRFLRAKEQMLQRDFEGVDHMIRLSCLFHLILTAVAVLAAIVSCIQSWTGYTDLLALAALALTGVCSFLVLHKYRSLPTYDIENPE